MLQSYNFNFSLSIKKAHKKKLFVTIFAFLIAFYFFLPKKHFEVDVTYSTFAHFCLNQKSGSTWRT